MWWFDVETQKWVFDYHPDYDLEEDVDEDDFFEEDDVFDSLDDARDEGVSFPYPSLRHLDYAEIKPFIGLGSFWTAWRYWRESVDELALKHAEHAAGMERRKTQAERRRLRQEKRQERADSAVDEQ